MTAEVTIRGALSCQVCVPSDWSDDRVRTFLETENPCGTESGWSIRRQGDPHLNGDDERVKCVSRLNHVHIMLDT